MEPAGIKERKLLIVEGSDRRRRHRHVTVSPSDPQNTNADGDVTKIEVELAEAPDKAENRLSTILVGSMPSELDSMLEINSTYPGGFPGTGGALVVRAEEVLIVILVLVLWVAAIALFFNRWGKIRMLEPYQPKFQQQHRQSCVMIDQTPLPHRSCSKFNIHCLEHGQVNGEEEISRPRQNSVFVGSSASLLPGCQDTPRRAKSAVDLQTFVQAEYNAPQVEEDPANTLKPTTIESWRNSPRDRRRSVCQFDRAETLTRPLQRERGMSICQFDRMDVYGRPPQRERGMSICHFDRMDILAPRSLQRDRESSVYHFDRMDVLARPLQRERGNSIIDRMDVRPACLGKSLLRERRTSVCNFLDRSEDPARSLQRNRRLSVSNYDRIEPLENFGRKEPRDSVVNVAEQEPQPGCSSTTYYFDGPSCSTSTDVVLGYKATCV